MLVKINDAIYLSYTVGCRLHNEIPVREPVEENVQCTGWLGVDVYIGTLFLLCSLTKVSFIIFARSLH
jgi:hypothetical protein